MDLFQLPSRHQALLQKEGAWYVYQNWSWFRFSPRLERKEKERKKVASSRYLPAVWRRFVFVPPFWFPNPHLNAESNRLVSPVGIKYG